MCTVRLYSKVCFRVEPGFAAEVEELSDPLERLAALTAYFERLTIAGRADEEAREGPQEVEGSFTGSAPETRDQRTEAAVLDEAADGVKPAGGVPSRSREEALSRREGDAVPAEKANALLPRALPAADLVRVANEVVASVAALSGKERAATVRPPELDCTVLVGELVHRLYPARRWPGGFSAAGGIRAARALADDAIRPTTAEQRLVRGPGWRPVTSWQALVRAVEAAGDAATAVVVERRPSGQGHTYALHRTSDGVRWIELQAPPGARVALRPHLPAPLPRTMAIVIDGAGHVRTDSVDARREDVSLLTDALLDPPARPDLVGKIGFEFEDRHPVVSRAGHDLVKQTLAIHDSGAQVVADKDRFFRGDDGRLYATSGHAPEGVEGVHEEQYILEFVSPPLAALEEDSAAPAQDGQLALLEAFRQLLGDADALGEPIPLSLLLPSELGWTITEVGETTAVFPAPSGAEEFGYTQFTVGVPTGGLQAVLELAEDRLEVADIRPIMAFGRTFGAQAAAHYASSVLHAPVRPEDVPFLTELEHVDEISGYAWLTFQHVVAYPLLKSQLSHIGLVKNLMPIALRNPFHVVREALSLPVSAYLSANVTALVEIFEREFQGLLEHYATRLRKSSPSARTALALEGEHGSSADYLHYALTGFTPNGERVYQEKVLGLNDFADLDTTREGTKLALLEFRHYAVDPSLRDPRGTASDMSGVAVSATADQLTRTLRHAYTQETRFTEGGISPGLAAAVLADRLVPTLQDFFRLGETRYPTADGIFLPLLTSTARSSLAAAVARRHTGNPLPSDVLSHTEIVEGHIDRTLENFQVSARAVSDLQRVRQAALEVRQSIAAAMRQGTAADLTPWQARPGTGGEGRNPAFDEVPHSAEIDALLARFKQEVRPAVRVWEQPAADHVGALNDILKSRGSRSLVFGTRLPSPVWAIRTEVEVKWFTLGVEMIESIDFAGGQVVSIDINDNGQLTGPAAQAMRSQAGTAASGGARTEFCGLSLGFDLGEILR